MFKVLMPHLPVSTSIPSTKHINGLALLHFSTLR